MNAVDTNLWIYCHDTLDPNKQLVAQHLIASLRPLALPWQVGCEFIAASRKLAPQGFDVTQAWSALTQMQAMANVLLLPTPQLWPATQVLQSKHGLSFWDGLLVAACIDGGVQVLFTEDMGAPRIVDSLSLVNPFVSGDIP